nr:transposase [Mesorhizobium sp. J8]
MRVEILGAERRRRWGDRKKLDIAMWLATGTEVAERHDVTRQQIYTWRRELGKGLCCRRRVPCSSVDMPVAQSEPGMAHRDRVPCARELPCAIRGRVLWAKTQAKSST